MHSRRHVSLIFAHATPLGAELTPFPCPIRSYVILKHSFPLVTASSYALMQAVEPLRINRYRRALEDPGQLWVPKHIRERCHVGCIGTSYKSSSPLLPGASFAAIELSLPPLDRSALTTCSSFRPPRRPPRLAACRKGLLRHGQVRGFAQGSPPLLCFHLYRRRPRIPRPRRQAAHLQQSLGVRQRRLPDTTREHYCRS